MQSPEQKPISVIIISFPLNLFDNFSNVFVRWDYSAEAVGLVNCDIKYFAIVEHDQTSEEIVKTSQLLMDKFDIH